MSESYSTLIEAAELHELLDGETVVVDCRFFLDDPLRGRAAYEAGHIPTAVYVDLETDLSGPVTSKSGRHPLPSLASMRDLFGRLGIGPQTQVVAYDQGIGPAAARLWWMLRYMSHDKAAVLNGGITAWLAAGYALQSGRESNEAVSFVGRPRSEWLVGMQEIYNQKLLIDSRAPERYRGEVEPLDPVPGRIPGAVNHFYQANQTKDGRYLPPAELQAAFSPLLGDVAADEATFYCGSGVTACNNLLALAYAGLGMGKLYAGSWSEWCGDSENPVESG